jgi:predicted RNase H-like nuclease (RuvC/YqgF family)
MAELINTRPPPSYWRGEITRAIQSRKVIDQSLQHMLDQLGTLDQTTAIINLAQRIFDEQKKNRQWIDRYEPMLTHQDEPMMRAFMQFADNRNLFAIPSAMVDCLFKEKEEWMERLRHDRMFKELREQNDYMKRRLSEQAKQIDQLKKQVGQLTETTSQMDHELKNDLSLHKAMVESELKDVNQQLRDRPVTDLPEKYFELTGHFKRLDDTYHDKIESLRCQYEGLAETVKTLVPGGWPASLSKPAVVDHEASTLHQDVQSLKDEVMAIKETVEELKPKRYHTRSKARATTTQE